MIVSSVSPHPARPASRRRFVRRAMTLVEVMIALVILTGALVGMGKFIAGFSHSTTDGSMNSTASDLVLDRLEQVKASSPYTNLNTYAATENSIPGFPGFVRTTQVTRTNNATTDYTTVTVTVSNVAMYKPVKKSTIISAF
jgi:prepilin-type N-terminal cleavage/methylation domain-containing protein